MALVRANSGSCGLRQPQCRANLVAGVPSRPLVGGCAPPSPHRLVLLVREHRGRPCWLALALRTQLPGHHF